MTLRKRFQGILPALLTPYDAHGEINVPALQKLMAHCEARGAAGFYVCGSTGESLLLRPDERMRMLEGAMETGTKLPVIAHIGAPDTTTTVALAKHAKQVGAAAVSSIPPVFFNYSKEELLRFYFDIADASDLPVFIYLIPGRTGVEFTLEQIVRMAEHPNIRGIKFTSTVLHQMERIRAALPEFVIFSGPDEMCLASLSMGADGAIGSTYNLSCAIYAQLYAAFQKGDMQTALDCQRRANDVLDVLFEVGDVFHGLKAVFRLMGLDLGDPRKPYAPITSAQMETARKALPLLPDGGSL